MSTFTFTTRPSNGVSFGYKHTVLAGEASTATKFLFDFQCEAYDIVAIIQMRSVTTGQIKSLGNALITYPAKGQVMLDCNSSLSPSTGDVIEIIAQRNVGDLPVSGI
jgi:hypothetical protein